MIQLWVNLPAKDKMTHPGYQSITADVIPDVALADGAGKVRVIAGHYDPVTGPAFSPLNVWDMQLNQGHDITLRQPEGWSTALVVLEGESRSTVQAGRGEGQLVVFSQQGEAMHLEATANAKVLLMAGEPLQADCATALL
jgi:redox-sensitive bicupin YhaK (pirin superfamily)